MNQTEATELNLHCKSFSGETTFEALPQSAKRIANSAVYLECRRALPPMERKNKAQRKEYIQPDETKNCKPKRRGKFPKKCSET